MNTKLLEEIVNAVLYEGYILYPYRASSKKNRRERFTFGRVYPEAYSATQKGAEPSLMQTECLVEAAGPGATLRVDLRFLQPLARELGALEPPRSGWTGEEVPYRPVPELRVGREILQTWQEAVERRVESAPLQLDPSSPARQRVPFHFMPRREVEPLHDGASVIGVVVRRQAEITGTLEVAAESLSPGLFKVSARVVNQSAISPAECECADQLLLRTLASTHTILGVEHGAFVSLIDPPERCRPAAALCQNLGTWPVLVGDAAMGERDTLLSSPIILYDYPQVAPESSGPLFDGTEIDEILTLRVLTLTEDEKCEMRRVDEQARRLLERTENLPQASLLQLHGTMRPASTEAPQSTVPGSGHTPGEVPSLEVQPTEFDDFFGTNTRLEGVPVGGVYLRAGSRVRIRAKSRADLMDLVLTGQTAIVQAVEQDLEKRVHLALVLENDPGKDLGLLRQPGHRFFFGADEVEPLAPEAT